MKRAEEALVEKGRSRVLPHVSHVEITISLSITFRHIFRLSIVLLTRHFTNANPIQSYSTVTRLQRTQKSFAPAATMGAATLIDRYELVSRGRVEWRKFSIQLNSNGAL